MKMGESMSFVEYKGNKSCFICGGYERLVVNRNDDFELVLFEKCINGYKIALKTK